MWTRIRLQNFKGYKDTGELTLRPLTILIGPNGGGKSTLLKFLMTLKQTAASTDTSTTLITSVTDIDQDKYGYVDLGLYKDYVYMGETNRSISFFLGWDIANTIANSLHRSNPLEHVASAIEVTLNGRQPGRQVVVQKLSYHSTDRISEDDNNDVLISLERSDKAAYTVYLPEQRRNEKLKAKSKDYEPQKFYRFPAALLKDLPYDTEAILREYPSQLESRLLDTYYLGPLRQQPRRIYSVTGERHYDLGSKGEKIDSVLHADDDGELIHQTSEWLQRLGIAESISLSRISKGNIFHINIHGKNQRQKVNIADFGFGASQILPVIVECLYAPRGSTLLIEQPEIHLNAHHQLELPNFFADIISKEKGKQVIVETHSEYFLKRISTLIAKGVLNQEQVIVYYCHADKDGSHIQPITLDEKGRYSRWPEDFLAEGYEGSVEHMDAMQAGESES